MGEYWIMQKASYRVVCPRCGETFDERLDFCPNCDTPNRKMICRSCNAQINKSARACPECGAKNRKTIQPKNIAILAVPVIAAVLAVVIITAKPSEKQAAQSTQEVQETMNVPESAESSSDGSSVEPSATISAEKVSGKKIELTVPADFVGEDITQQALDEKVNTTDGFESAVLNSDGSVTYVMMEDRHDELMQEIRSNIDSQLADMSSSADYPNVTAVSASDDYAAFTVTLSTDTVGLQESFLVLAFYMYGGMYNAFNGTPIDDVTVTFVDQSGAVLQEANSKDEPAQEEAAPDPTAGKETGKFVASRERDKYHTPSCRWVEDQMLEENKIWFDSAADAEAAGFKPCGTCHPKD